MTTTAGTLSRPRLTASDRCDRCGAQAYVRVRLTKGGELLFCSHHNGEYFPNLRLQGAVITADDRMMLNT